MKNNPFQKIGRARFPRSAFNLSYEKKFTADMGILYPILADECVPGDVWSIGNSAVIRFQPLVAPILHQIKVKTYYFFVPYRLLDENWEEFITRGEDGNSVVTLPVFNPEDYDEGPAAVMAKGTLWDFLGFPTGNASPPVEFCPLDYPRQAYNMVWNEFFRDQNLQTEIPEGVAAPGATVGFQLKRRNWTKDYFTSALPFQQRGNAPALPVVGTIAADADFDLAFDAAYVPGTPLNVSVSGNFAPAGAADVFKDAVDANFNNNTTVSVTSSLTSVDIADLRLAFQLQVWMERNARAGVRYTEFLNAHFNVAPYDARLQRPEFIGGTTNDVLISEVLQTSSTDSEPTPQGNLAGHGIAVQTAQVGKYRVEEFGVMIGLMCVYPTPAYQNGINRQWLRRTTYDFYFPEFANLSEQAIYNGELCTIPITTDPDGSQNLDIFGYTGRYNEMRYKPNMVCGDMRDTFDYWHLGRQFDPASPPALNEDFIVCDPRKDVFAVPSEPGMVVSFGNHLNVLRPMPIIAEPMKLGGY
ncbi:MAG: hypothetical protein H7831_17545 [Magnetococcus sp. WYHC-3]